MSVIERQNDFVKLHLPALHDHRAFVVAKDAATIEQLGAQERANHLTKANIGLAHKDLPGKLRAIGCLTPTQFAVTAGHGNGVHMTTSLQAALPNLGELYRRSQSETRVPKLREVPTVFEIRGGSLRLGYQPSQNAGTIGVQWIFCDGSEAEMESDQGRPISDSHPLTDIVALEATGRDHTISITRRGAPAAVVNEGETLWFFNAPTKTIKKDTTKYLIEDAHHYFNLFETRPAKAIWARTSTRFDRVPVPKDPEGKELTFFHPCISQRDWDALPREQRYMPPDSDPCFAVMI
jgi:hypothetical protein